MKLKMGIGRRGRNRDYPDSCMQMTLFCVTSQRDLRAMVGSFVEVCRSGLKVNAGKSKVMVLGGEEGLEYEVWVGGIQLEHV